MRKEYNEKTTLSAPVFVLLIFFNITTLVTAQETSLTEQTKQTSTTREITSDSLKWEYEKGIALFTGNVAMRGEEGDINCIKMTVFFDEQDEIKNMIGEGEAGLIREKQKGGGEIIEIYPSDDLIVLKGSAWISSDKAMFQGEEIRFDTEKEIINITKGVKGEIQTGNEEKSMNRSTEEKESN